MYDPKPKFQPKAQPRVRPRVAVPSYLRESGQVGNWLFYNGAEDILYDFSGEKNNGAIDGPVWTDEVSPAWTLEFGGAGSGDNVDISGFPVKDTSVTIISWFYAESIGSDNRELVFWGDGSPQWELRLDGHDGTTDFFWYDGTVHGIQWSNLPTTGEWHCLAGAYDDETGDYALFLDGSKEATATDAVSPSADGTGNRIGRHPPGYGEPFDGFIGLTQIYIKRLSDEEIKGRTEDTKPLYIG